MDPHEEKINNHDITVTTIYNISVEMHPVDLWHSEWVVNSFLEFCLVHFILIKNPSEKKAIIKL